MITASFLVKNLLHAWQPGERRFWDTLVDADPGQHYLELAVGGGHQPRRRTMVPRIQSRTRRRKSSIPTAGIAQRHVPEAGTAAYTAPITDLRSSRQRALDAYSALRKDT